MCISSQQLHLANSYLGRTYHDITKGESTESPSEQAKEIAKTVANDNSILQQLMDSQNVNKDQAKAKSVEDKATAKKSPKLSGEDENSDSQETTQVVNFVNVVASAQEMTNQNKIQKNLLEQERIANLQAADQSRLGVDSATNAGTHMVVGSLDSLGGIVAGSVLQGAAVLGSTVKQLKANNMESKSLTENAKTARNIRLEVSENQQAFGRNQGHFSEGGAREAKDAESILNRNQQKQLQTANQHDYEHEKVLKEAQKQRMKADIMKTGGGISKQVVESGANVSAAGENKQAEIERANSHLHNEGANTQSTQAKKTAESTAEIMKAFIDSVNNNNSTNSSIAEKLR